LSAAFALFFTYVSPLAIGSMVLTFFVSGILYVVLSKVMRSNSIEKVEGEKTA